MAIEPTRKEALEVVERLHGRIAPLFAGLSDEQLTAYATIGGGDWSAKDLLLHLAAWERLAVEAIEDWSARAPLRFYEARGRSRDVDDFNRALLEGTGSVPAAQARRDAEAMHLRLVAAIEDVSDEDWNAAPYFEPPRGLRCLAELVGRILGSQRGAFTHVSDHIDDLSGYVERAESESA